MFFFSRRFIRRRRRISLKSPAVPPYPFFANPTPGSSGSVFVFFFRRETRFEQRTRVVRRNRTRIQQVIVARLFSVSPTLILKCVPTFFYSTYWRRSCAINIDVLTLTRGRRYCPTRSKKWNQSHRKSKIADLKKRPLSANPKKHLKSIPLVPGRQRVLQCLPWAASLVNCSQVKMCVYPHNGLSTAGWVIFCSWFVIDVFWRRIINRKGAVCVKKPYAPTKEKCH